MEQKEQGVRPLIETNLKESFSLVREERIETHWEF